MFPNTSWRQRHTAQKKKKGGPLLRKLNVRVFYNGIFHLQISQVWKRIVRNSVLGEGQNFRYEGQGFLTSIWFRILWLQGSLPYHNYQWLFRKGIKIFLHYIQYQILGWLEPSNEKLEYYKEDPGLKSCQTLTKYGKQKCHAVLCILVSFQLKDSCKLTNTGRVLISTNARALISSWWCS